MAKIERDKQAAREEIERERQRVREEFEREKQAARAEAEAKIKAMEAEIAEAKRKAAEIAEEDAKLKNAHEAEIAEAKRKLAEEEKKPHYLAPEKEVAATVAPARQPIINAPPFDAMPLPPKYEVHYHSHSHAPYDYEKPVVRNGRNPAAGDDDAFDYEEKPIVREKPVAPVRKADEDTLHSEIQRNEKLREQAERLEIERLEKLAAEKREAEERRSHLDDLAAEKAEAERRVSWAQQIANEQISAMEERNQRKKDGTSFGFSREDVLDRMDEMLENDYDYPVEVVIKQRQSDKWPDVLRAGNWTFAVMVESKEHVIKFIARMDARYAGYLKTFHPQIQQSAVEGAEDWHKIIIDQTFFTNREVYSMFDYWYSYVMRHYHYDRKLRKYLTDEDAAAHDDQTIVSRIIREAMESDAELARAEVEKAQSEQRMLRGKKVFATKREIAAYIKNLNGGSVQISERDNPVGSGWPAADTYYSPNGLNDVGTRKKVCYAYMYELKDGSLRFIAKLPKVYAEVLAKTHTHLCRSRFPVGKNWYVSVVDSTYKSVEEIYEILDRAKQFVESTEKRDGLRITKRGAL